MNTIAEAAAWRLRWSGSTSIRSRTPRMSMSIWCGTKRAGCAWARWPCAGRSAGPGPASRPRRARIPISVDACDANGVVLECATTGA
ncbi:hypothetical protein A8E25_23615 [Burkholderia cenocepacia]|nr:hypothetical protein A8D61_02415 [Burkholderia cenocepacia]KKI83037.1 hypothetical protein WQ49_03555 [Burkholderia cenocepacia]ONJ17754.1 hypothetical protein A8D82_30950 [Burkholderia cenocepacia]ONO06155.1 hypothetical protein A8D70_27915 [Burkholderia cenocepacia]ONO16799.1 hypothetical protein A8D69_09640 [Burkholderia cenocepacia]